MRIDTLITLMPDLHQRDCIVTFDDGDSYLIRDLDLQGMCEGKFEIVVAFTKCLGRSKAREDAMQQGYLQPQRTSWTSTVPREPIGRTYYAEEIASVFDREKDYDVFRCEAE